MATKAPTKPERASERAMRETQGGRAAAKPATPTPADLIAESQKKATAVLVEKHAWTARRLNELAREIAATDRRRERLIAEETAVSAERSALADAIRQLGGDPGATSTEASS